MKKTYDDDDGRTVADMSGLPDRSLLGSWTGIRRKKTVEPPAGNGRSTPVEPIDRETRRWAVLGAMKASLGIGLIYVAVFGIVILLMVLLW